MRPGAHIHPHCGKTNRRLILHFALRGSFLQVSNFNGYIDYKWVMIGAKNVWFRVGDKADDAWVESYGGGDGNAIVFDDSFEHEVKHRGEEDRYVLLIVLRHPDVHYVV